MATLTVQTIARESGLGTTDPTYAAADVAGDEFANPSGRTFFHIKNGDGSPHTVTFDSIEACSQGGDHDLAVVVAAGEERMIGPFPTARWNDGSGLVQVSYDAVTSVTVAAISLASS